MRNATVRDRGYAEMSNLEATAALKAVGDRVVYGVVEPTAAHADLIEKSLGPITSLSSKNNVSVHKTQTSVEKLSETPTEARAQFYAPEQIPSAFLFQFSAVQPENNSILMDGRFMDRVDVMEFEYAVSNLAQILVVSTTNNKENVATLNWLRIVVLDNMLM